MKVLITKILILLGVFNSLAQQNIHYTKDSDTTSIKYTHDVENRFDIEPICGLQEPFVFRSWNPRSLLEIRKDSTNQLSGSITYMVHESSQNNSGVYTKVFNLSRKEVAKMYKIITQSKVDTIPDKKYITGWPWGFDGYTYTYETKNGSVYSHKSYWCAGNYKLIPKAVAVEKFNKELYSCLDEGYFKAFNNGIPFLGWLYPGSAMYTGKILTAEERRRYDGEIWKKGPYMNKTTHYKLVYNEFTPGEPQNDTTTTITRNWRGYKFVNVSEPDGKGRMYYQDLIILQKDTLPNQAIFNEKYEKLLQKINRKLEQQFLKMKKEDIKETNSYLEDLVFTPFEIDKLLIEINDEKSFTFIAQYDVGMACLPVMFDRVTIPYSKIRKYLIDTLTKVNK
ncbi:hypothetical protein ACLI1A_02440 [Flavobacterium sp. RHBU_3]|uniref:hypothetical protein n=1 Tax=Flavobacterium sp. RHBU_3 TaxID=3391184 RepID=UPI003984AA96